jgi:hypothetical protein
MENEAADICQAGKIAFLGYMEFEDGASYRGAILATDDWGKPLEFRCTAPVRPTAVQRTLYGSTLMPHILVELIAKPLMDALNEKPMVVLTSEALFLTLRYRVDVPVVLIRRQSADMKETIGPGENDSHSILMGSESGRFEPVIMEAHWEFPQDAEVCGRLLKGLFGRWDIIEPFERLQKGLEYVHNEKVLAS